MTALIDGETFTYTLRLDHLEAILKKAVDQAMWIDENRAALMLAGVTFDTEEIEVGLASEDQLRSNTPYLRDDDTEGNEWDDKWALDIIYMPDNEVETIQRDGTWTADQMMVLAWLELVESAPVEHNAETWVTQIVLKLLISRPLRMAVGLINRFVFLRQQTKAAICLRLSLIHI